MRLRLILLNLSSKVLTDKPVKLFIALVLAFMAPNLLAQELPVDEQYYVADIELQTADEFRQLLERAEQLFILEESFKQDQAKVTLVLHGPVLKSLLRENYLQNKAMVDLAARLSALEVIDVKACRTWMTGNDISSDKLQPFIEVVAYGPAEVGRLVNDRGYLYF